ncbi:MAG: YedE-related selenium metabolism membrane protein [Oscillospiraceae bacterium]|nr:YedE-related selenium metabolism membrane protein [Oscillospiraceae bacterium]
MKEFFKRNWLILTTGFVIGVIALALGALGNPGNMGFCVACFLRDIAGSLGLHGSANVQYFRPEIVGILLGSTLAALAFREFKGRGGSSPVLRFILGAFVMIGALMFLGCPLRMIIRLGSGDLNALLGLAGFFAGILAGAAFLKKGFNLKRAYTISCVEGAAFPVAMLVLFILSVSGIFGVFLSSEEGPGSLHTFWVVSLVAGLVVGFLCQRSRMCMVGGLRDVVLFRDCSLISGFIVLFLTVLVGSLILKDGAFSFAFSGQPVAHTDGLWNFLGMALVGWASILLGGCPLRQLVLAGEGNSDSAIAVLGMIAGAAFCHNWGLASSADGPTANGKVAVVAGFLVVALISIICTFAKKKGEI